MPQQHAARWMESGRRKGPHASKKPCAVTDRTQSGHAGDSTAPFGVIGQAGKIAKRDRIRRAGELAAFPQ